jgi:hypothetical protein
MIVCWLAVNTLWRVGMQVGAKAVALGSTLDLPRDLRFDTLAKTAFVGGSRFSSVMARCAPPGGCGRKSTPFRPSKLLPLGIPI